MVKKVTLISILLSTLINAGELSTNKYDSNTKIGDTDFMAGISYAYISWEAASLAGGNNGYENTAEVSYNIESSIYQKIYAEGRIQGNRLAISYMKNESSDKTLNKSSEYLSFFVDFNNLAPDNMYLRIEVSQGNIVGEATYTAKDIPETKSLTPDGTVQPFEGTLNRYALLFLTKKGFGGGFEYSNYSIPTAVSFKRDSTVDYAEYVALDPKFEINTFKIKGFFDYLTYARNHFRNYSNWAGSIAGSIGIDQRQLDKENVKRIQSEIAADRGINVSDVDITDVSYGLSVDTEFYFGWLYQKRLFDSNNIGYSTMVGYQARLSYNGAITATGESVSETYQIGSRRYDMWHGPYVSVNIIF